MAKKKTVKKSVKKTVKKTAKKGVKKPIPKKAKKTKVVKKPVKKTKKKIMVIAPDERCFWVNYGPALNSILALHNALQNITEEQFKHHVNKTKNDFAMWVENVLEDSKTAAKIRKASTLNATIKAVKTALKDYNI